MTSFSFAFFKVADFVSWMCQSMKSQAGWSMWHSICCFPDGSPAWTRSRSGRCGTRFGLLCEAGRFSYDFNQLRIIYKFIYSPATEELEWIYLSRVWWQIHRIKRWKRFGEQYHGHPRVLPLSDGHGILLLQIHTVFAVPPYLRIRWLARRFNLEPLAITNFNSVCYI